MAQLVERLVRNEEASGSNPLISTKKRTRYTACSFFGGYASTEPLNYQRFARGARNEKFYFFHALVERRRFGVSQNPLFLTGNKYRSNAELSAVRANEQNR